ncbi:MAG: flagellar biosynthesis regulator FlaF [Alphaproteobacteria bacterium]
MNNNDQVKNAEKEAVILLNQAMALAKASMSNNEHEIIRALDSNLKLWVEIETSLKSAKNLLPEDIKANLMKLSKFVERMILSKGLKMTKTDFDCLVNINMQISEGLIEAVKNNLAREEAFSLLKCAVDLSNARENNSTSDLISALDNNMKLWFISKRWLPMKNPLPRETKGNLIKLADYVSAARLRSARTLIILIRRLWTA